VENFLYSIQYGKVFRDAIDILFLLSLTYFYHF